MRIFITGATGFIGIPLVKSLLAEGHQIIAFVRDVAKARAKLPQAVIFENSLNQHRTFDDFDAVINLAGEPIFDKPWTLARKAKLISSRIDLTEQLVEKINNSKIKPKVFISGSATGFYGDRLAEILTEQASKGEGFTAELADLWEKTANQAHCRVCCIRTGTVLSPNGGALAKMLPFYRWGLGAKIGEGSQYMPWIALEDMISGILFLLTEEKIKGAVNFSAPNPETYQKFHFLLSRKLNKLAFFKVPSIVLRVLFCSRSSLLLNSQRAIPVKLQKAGFSFKYQTLEDYFSSHREI